MGTIETERAVQRCTLPRADVGLRSGAQISVHCVLLPLVVDDLDGNRVAEMQPGESAVFGARARKLLWWALPPRWRRIA